MFVAISWVSFVIPPDSIPGRVTLLITDLLVQVNIANSAFANAPTSDSINYVR